MELCMAARHKIYQPLETHTILVSRILNFVLVFSYDLLIRNIYSITRLLLWSNIELNIIPFYYWMTYHVPIIVNLPPHLHLLTVCQTINTSSQKLCVYLKLPTSILTFLFVSYLQFCTLCSVLNLLINHKVLEYGEGDNPQRQEADCRSQNTCKITV